MPPRTPSPLLHQHLVYSSSVGQGPGGGAALAPLPGGFWRIAATGAQLAPPSSPGPGSAQRRSLLP